MMLAEMLDGRPADALTRLPKFRDSKEVTPMMKSALEGTARIFAGETEAGSALLKEVAWSGFMPQERIVFRDLLVKPRISGLPVPDLETAKPDTDPTRTPAWRKALERPVDPDNSKPGTNPNEAPAWRKAIERLGKDRAGEVLPPLPPPPVPGAERPAPPDAPP
jgi:hypothetical protein